jgi:hypothetical protein
MPATKRLVRDKRCAVMNDPYECPPTAQRLGSQTPGCSLSYPAANSYRGQYANLFRRGVGKRNPVDPLGYNYFKVVGLNRKNTPVSMPITKIDRLQYSSCASSLLVSEIFIQCFSQVEATMDKRPDNHLIKTCKGDYKAK